MSLFLTTEHSLTLVYYVAFSILLSIDSNRSLLFTELRRNVLYQVDLETNPQRAAPLPIHHNRGLTAVGFDPVDRLIYYAESYPGLIRRSFLNGTADEVIINGVYYANRLAIDFINRNIYFTDTSRNRIDVAALSGMHRAMLITTQGPEGIALDLENGLVFGVCHEPSGQRSRKCTEHTTVVSFEFGKISIVNELNDLAGNQIASYVLSETLPRTISRGSTVFSIMRDKMNLCVKLDGYLTQGEMSL